VHPSRWRAAVPGRRDSNRCGTDAPQTRPWRLLAALSWVGRAGCVAVIHLSISAAGDGRPPGVCEKPGDCVHPSRWRAAVPGRRDSNRCGTDAPQTRRGGSWPRWSWSAVPAASLSFTSASRRPGTAALQALRGNPAIVCIHHAGGRPSPAAETRTDAEPTPRSPVVAGPGRVVLGRPCRLRRCHSPQHLGGRGRPPSRRLRETRRLCASITLEGGRPRPPRLEPMRNRRPARPVVAGPGRVVLGRPCRLRRCHSPQHLGGRGRPPSRRLRGNPAIVCIHRAGGRPSPAAETRTDAEPTPRSPVVAGPGRVVLGRPCRLRRCHSPQHLGGRGRPPSRRLRGTRRLCASITLEGGRPRPPRSNRCGTDAPQPRRGGSWPRWSWVGRAGCVAVIHLSISAAGDGRPPGACEETRRLSRSITLEGGRPRPPRLEPMLEYWTMGGCGRRPYSAASV
jgi:hypothetical protein